MRGSDSRSPVSRIIAALSTRPGLYRIIANTAWLSADKILRLLIGLFVGVWLARYLGPQVFGQYSFAFALVALFAVFSRLGLDSVLVREIVQFPESRYALLGTALTLKLAGGAIGYAGVVLCVVLFYPGESTSQLLVVVVAAGLVLQAFDVVEIWFQSQLQSKYSVAAKNAAFIVVTALKIALIVVGAPVVAFAAAAVLEIIIGAVGLIVGYRLSGQSFAGWRVSLDRAKSLLRPGFPLILAGVAVSLYMRIDQAMIARMLGNEAVGAYSAAIRLTEATYFIPTVLVASLLPAVVSVRTSSQAKFYDRMQRLFDLMVMAAVTIAIPLSVFSSSIVNLLYGEAYSSAAGVLAIHAWASVLVFLGAASSSYLLAENLTMVSFYRTALGAVANILLNLVFIPNFGIKGAAWATLISYCVATYAVLLDRRSRIGGVMMLRALWPTRLFSRGAIS